MKSEKIMPTGSIIDVRHVNIKCYIGIMYTYLLLFKRIVNTSSACEFIRMELKVIL